MQIRVVNIYIKDKDLEKDLVLGTAHLHLGDYDLELKGVYFKKRRDFWFVSLPAFISTHSETKQKVRCPFFSFSDRERQKKFEIEIKKAIQKELEERLMQEAVS